MATDRGITIGYFSQDVGEMSGRSAAAEVMESKVVKIIEDQISGISGICK